MASIITVPLRRHVRPIAYIIIISLLIFAGGYVNVETHYTNGITFYVVGCVCGFVILAIYFAYRKFFHFPVKIVILEDGIEIECRFLLLFPRYYKLKKEEVRILYRYTTEVVKYRVIRIIKTDKRDGIEFNSIALQNETLDIILDALTENGYKIDLQKRR